MEILSQRRSHIGLVLYMVFLCLSVAFATRDKNTLSTVQPQTDIFQHECMGDSVNGNCIGSDRSEASYSYDPLPIDDGLLQNGFDINGFDKIVQDAGDYLSERDQVFYETKNSSFWQAKDQNTLRQVMLVHRHGDRTPINFAPKDNIANEPFWRFHGLGQLTNRGKARLHLLGKIMRQRYDNFLNGSVNKNFRNTRASGSLRCIESAQVFLSSFLALDNNNSQDASSLIWDKSVDRLAQLWQPASVLTLSARYDGLMNEGADCKRMLSEYDVLDNGYENKRLSEEFKYEADVLKKEIDFDIDHFYKWFWAASFLEVERSYFEKKINPSLLAIYDRLQQAGDRALVIYQSTLKSRRLRAGLLINDILENMKNMRSNSQLSSTKKFIQYSGHDITLIFLLGLLNNIERYPFRPDYASNIVFELHQDQSEWFVKIFYMPHVPSRLFELHVDACEENHPKNRCTLTKFTELMHKYRILSWVEWMQECDNPLTSLNPYEENI